MEMPAKMEYKATAAVDKKGAIMPMYSRTNNKLVKLSTMQQLETIQDRQSDKLLVLLFWAKWYPECEELRQSLEKVSVTL